MLNLDQHASLIGLEGRVVEERPLAVSSSTRWIELVNETGTRVELVTIACHTADEKHDVPIGRRLANHGFIDIDFAGEGWRVTKIVLTLRRAGAERSYSLAFSGPWVLWASVQIYDDPEMPFGLVAFEGE